MHFYELSFKMNSVFSKLHYTGLKLLFKLPFTLTNQVNGFKNQLQRWQVGGTETSPGYLNPNKMSVKKKKDENTRVWFSSALIWQFKSVSALYLQYGFSKILIFLHVLQKEQIKLNIDIAYLYVIILAIYTCSRLLLITGERLFAKTLKILLYLCSD